MVLFSLCFGLSCSIWNTPLPVEDRFLRKPVEVLSSEPLGPGPREYVQERFFRYQTGLAPFEIQRTAEAIVEESERWGLDRELILAVIYTESAFHSFAVSNKGAMGLMQIMPATGEMLAAELETEWRPEILFEPVTNVRMGTRYLALLYEKYGSWDRALAAYNWGPIRIDRRLKAGHALPDRYVTQVLVQLDSPPSP